MRSQLILPAIFVCILHAACTKQKEELAASYFKPPKIVEAKTYSELSDKHILSVFEDSKGNQSAGAHGGLAKFDGHSFQNYTPALGANDSTEVLSILEDNEKNIWFATDDKGHDLSEVNFRVKV